MIWYLVLLSPAIAAYTVLNPDFSIIEPKGLRATYPGKTVINTYKKKHFSFYLTIL